MTKQSKTYTVKLKLTLSQLGNLRFCCLNGESILEQKADSAKYNPRSLPELVAKVRQNAQECRDLYRMIEDASPSYWADMSAETAQELNQNYK